MERDEALELLRGGPEGVAKWNEARSSFGTGKLPSLREANLRFADLKGVSFHKMDLAGADFSGANLENAGLVGADLRYAVLRDGKLRESRLKLPASIAPQPEAAAILSRPTNLRNANMMRADLRWAHLTSAILSYAHLIEVDFRGATLVDCELTGANLFLTHFGDTYIASDFSNTTSLRRIQHRSSSVLSLNAIASFKGNAPEHFLRGCGLTPWEVLSARLYDPALTASEIAEINQKIFNERAKGPLAINGVFISYAHADAKDFATKLHDALHESGANAWYDEHLVAGSVREQIQRQLRLQDVIVLVLSKESLGSRWVQHELRVAAERQHEENRSVLCPVAIDDTWKDPAMRKGIDPLDWAELIENLVVEFTGDFDAAYKKLWEGLQLNYLPKPPDEAEESA